MNKVLIQNIGFLLAKMKAEIDERNSHVWLQSKFSGFFTSKFWDFLTFHVNKERQRNNKFWDNWFKYCCNYKRLCSYFFVKKYGYWFIMCQIHLHLTVWLQKNYIEMSMYNCQFGLLIISGNWIRVNFMFCVALREPVAIKSLVF